MSKQLDVIEYFDRHTGKLCREAVMGDASIKWAYQTLSGKVFSSFLFGSSILSRILGWYFNSSLSKRKIAGAIEDLEINTSEFLKEEDEFTCFNDFFTRKLQDGSRPFSAEESDFSSPADGRLLVYDDLGESSKVKVKGVEDTLQSLFDRDITEFDGGKAAVVRLCPADYHRFHFPCNGTVIEQVKVKGKYHSVNPIALASKEKIFCVNKREYTIVQTEKFGKIAFMEVGAFGVAGIHQTFSGTNIEKMEEKGYFDFGGSTIVLIFQKDCIEFSEDLLKNSKIGVETLVKAGETMASALS